MTQPTLPIDANILIVENITEEIAVSLVESIGNGEARNLIQVYQHSTSDLLFAVVTFKSMDILHIAAKTLERMFSYGTDGQRASVWSPNENRAKPIPKYSKSIDTSTLVASAKEAVARHTASVLLAKDTITGTKAESTTNNSAAIPTAPPVPSGAPATASVTSPTTSSAPQSVSISLADSLSRYPFAAMNCGWLIEYVSALKNPDKSYTMCRILESLMCTAIATGDPFMEFAVVTFYTKFPTQHWGKAQALLTDGVSFELCRQVFEVLGLVKKYPSANPKSRKMLLSLVERLLEDISTVSVSTKSLSLNKAIPEIITSVRTQLTALRTQPDQEDALESLISWLKFLFSCLSSHQNRVPSFPEASQISCCNEDCPCATKIRNRAPVFVADIEKVKIIDCLIINAVTESDDYLANIAEELQERYPVGYCTRAVGSVTQNGAFAMIRMRLFHAWRLSKNAQQINALAGRRNYDTIEIALQRLKECVCDHSHLSSTLPLIDNSLQCLWELRDVTEVSPAAVQLLYTLQFDLSQLFHAISGLQYQLCVHAMDSNAGTKKLKCANPTCPGSNGELLKCSGCKITYYCSVDCQRADWKIHKALCKEIAAKKVASVPVSSLCDASKGEVLTLKPNLHM